MMITWLQLEKLNYKRTKACGRKHKFTFYAFCHVFVLLFSTISKSSIVSSSPRVTFEPLLFEAGYSDICCAGNWSPPNQNVGVAVGTYIGHHPVNLQRIHNLAPPSYKVVLSIIGIRQQIVSTTYALNSKIQLSLHSQSSTSFVARIQVERIQKLQYFRFNYLLISQYAYDDFVIDTFVDNTMRSINNINHRLNGVYTVAPVGSLRFFVLTSLDVVKLPANSWLVWSSSYFADSASNFHVDLWGLNTRFNAMKYTILTVKSSISHMHVELGVSKYYARVVMERIQSNGTGGCGNYNAQTSVTAPWIPSVGMSIYYSHNYFYGVYNFGSTNKISFGINYVSHNTALGNGYLTLCLIDNGMYTEGIVFYAYTCPDGYYVGKSPQCKPCKTHCIQCIDTKCLVCAPGTQLAPDKTNCLPNPPPPPGCSLYELINGVAQCTQCDISLKLIVEPGKNECRCFDGYAFDLKSNKCKQICPDGVVYEDQCDDNNTANNDGCSSACKFELGSFVCDIRQTPTKCVSTLELVYEVESIAKSQGKQFLATVILSPLNKQLPFSVAKQDFLQDDKLSQLIFCIIVEQNPDQTIYSPEYQLVKIENNKLHIFFPYNFTIENLKARILLNYSQTNYRDSIQTINFTLKGQNSPLEYSDFIEVYNNFQNGILVSTILSMTGLVVGLFVPKFIGLETIITMQLIYYSQLLISDIEKWPIGFAYFNYFKVASGLSEYVRLSTLVPDDNVSKKYHKVKIQKTAIQNYNINFLLLSFAFIAFCLTSLIRYHQQTRIERQISQKTNVERENKQRIVKIKSMLKFYNFLRKINETNYWLLSQLVVWSVLPIISAIGAEMMIENSSVILIPGKWQFLLNFRGLIMIISMAIVTLVWLNHIANMFLSQKTVNKIGEKPQQLWYKRLVVIYLFLIGALVFFFNEIKFMGVPISSSIVLGIHCLYTMIIVLIKPYENSLRIHAVGLYLSLILFMVYLVVINLLNLISYVDEFIIIGLGYLILGSVGILIVLTGVRLYYEIRYGEALQKRIQMEREKQKEEEEMRKKQRLIDKRKMFELEAKLKLQEKQKVRDLNSYLIETQIKQMQKVQLLTWLQSRCWEQEQKQKYYFKQFHEKPLAWMKKNDPKDYQKKQKQIQEMQQRKETKRKEVYSKPDYLKLTSKMRQDSSKKKQILRTKKLPEVNGFCIQM